ncbi:MAG TPA: hypothetical protein ENJ08_00335 [Gammaproteobacteria bacterium]|nr:hypothetical protein [Gammaproteobacteria bacterium]
MSREQAHTLRRSIDYFRINNYTYSMSKPDEIELKTALVAAATMKEHDKDPFFIAKTLLNQHYRLKFYEELQKAADRYLNHGQADRERMALLGCIEKIRTMERKLANDDIKDFGLE